MSALKERMEFARSLFRQKETSGQPLVQGRVAQAGFGSAGQAESSQMYDHNSGWTYASIRPIANRIAGQPINVAKVQDNPVPDERRMKSWEQSRLPPSMRKSHNISHLEPLESHPLIDALHDPNDLMVAYTLLSTTASSLQLTGKAYWWITKSQRREYPDIWPVPAHWVTPDHKEGFRSRWIIKPPGAAVGTPVSGDQVALFYYPDPMDPFQALAPAEAAQQSILASEAILESQRQGYNNGINWDMAVTTGDIVSPDGTNLGKEQLEQWQIEQIETRLRQLYQGPSKSRKLLVLDRVIEDVKRINGKPNEMDYMDSAEATKNAIMQTFGVSEVIAGHVVNANRASSVVATEVFLDNVINPTLEMMSQVITGWVLPWFMPENQKQIAWIEPAVPKNPEFDLEKWKFAHSAKAVTRNDIRTDLLGKPPMEGGDSIVMGIAETIVPVIEREHESQESEGAEQEPGATPDVQDMVGDGGPDVVSDDDGVKKKSGSLVVRGKRLT